VARVKNIFTRRIRNRECPKVLSVYQPSEVVSLRPCFFAIYSLCGFDVGLLFFLFVFSFVKASIGARRRCTTRRSEASRSVLRGTCRSFHNNASRSTSPTRRSEAPSLWLVVGST
jgi:hypothetical protein